MGFSSINNRLVFTADEETKAKNHHTLQISIGSFLASSYRTVPNVHAPFPQYTCMHTQVYDQAISYQKILLKKSGNEYCPKINFLATFFHKTQILRNLT
jgi:hypothetical protein